MSGKHHKEKPESGQRVLVVEKKAGKQAIPGSKKALNQMIAEHQKSEIELKISSTVSATILPLIDNLRRIGIAGDKCDELEKAAKQLTELTAEPKGSIRSIYLTEVESRIGTMLNSGYSDVEISQTLNIPIESVHSHQESLGRKLNLIEHRSPEEEMRFTFK